MLRQEGLAQSFPGAVGQGRDGVGAHAEQGSDVSGTVALDLGVPEHELPALGERGEGAGGGGVLEALDRGVTEGDAGVEGLHVVGGVQARPGPELVDPQAAHRGEEIGAEGHVRAAAALEDAEHLDEGLRDEVLHVAGGHELASQPTRSLDVAFEEVTVGSEVPTADRRDELGVAGEFDTGGDAHADQAPKTDCDGAAALRL